MEGTIGDYSFFKGKNGYQAREKTGVSGDRIKNDPAFARTRENGAEFGRAGKASKVLRTAFRGELLSTAGRAVVSRLTTEMHKVLKTDPTNARGERTVTEGAIQLLKGFEFNEGAPLTTTMLAPYQYAVDRAVGGAKVTIAPHVPRQVIAAPPGATHYELIMALGTIDFTNGKYSSASAKSGPLVLGHVLSALQTLEAVVEPAAADPMFILLGIEFTQLVNGTYYPMQNGSHNAMAIIEVSPGVRMANL